MPSRVYVWPCRRMVEHFHAPASQRPAIAARTAPCRLWAMRRPAPQPPSCASPPLCCAFDALPPPTSALLCNAIAVRPNTQPLLCQSSPSRCCPKPCRCDALLRSAAAALARAFPCRRHSVHCPSWPAHCFSFARRSGAAQCRRRASHCPAFASPCSAVPPLIGAPACLAAASPCSASALLCHSVASPSLAIALLRRATP